ncbi:MULTISPECIES: lipopolysaccharide transport periplasmic protein LptA [Vibrio oreintalis group]|uniref:lipopolysaccharide transport periplasmic protein LptA n=1 Tax=Vibrio oreintalis group TaxID=1891919 RepID=UPI00148D36E9|nr:MULTISPECIES: lipopolysaccharide transport periplasmic protein LptA [Vibrio oreintalis group]MCG9577151.1 lipopolysaccharide transport periplasmic protein LptA [Vibrio tubiashii]MDC5820747.1 lipopolysaccharide transport periplasmic protein LptA [Vibrio europaeus]MDC5838540.1 lipopolysaccharide transport periplasmic protein LptA [Vibrio europaeus]MDC5854791.1 lipopolysaccharide transport periplasmic protein LptA [Vibrio europaeus]MDC5869962.1 lipopolysaccharide transport periplasmic protein 
MKLSHLSLISCLLLSSQAMALSTDQDQPVYIDSDSQQLDMQSNKVTFLGDVKLKQGSININADKVIVIRDPKDGSIQEIEGYGDLATFSQLTDDGKTLYGEAKELYYVMVDDQLTMIDEAMLSQDDSVIRGTKIRYKISSQKLIADGKQKGDRVSTVLQPQAVQE